MFSPDLKYCPQCRDEYRLEIDRCAACGVLLLTGADFTAQIHAKAGSLRPRLGPLSADDQRLAIFEAPLNDLKPLQALLEAEGIGTLIGGGDGPACGKGCGPPKLFLEVRKEDAQDAMELLVKEQQRLVRLADHDTRHADAVFDPEAGEAVCPACGFVFATDTASCPDCGLCFG